MLNPDDIILFQGDSITDCGRSRESNGTHLGGGYPFLTASQLLSSRPGDNLQFRNLGISGNRIVDIAARWKEDAINVRPNLISILIGVNDTWHEFSRKSGVPLPKFERVYHEVLAETKRYLPDVRLVLCEPFVVPCGVVTSEWIPDVASRGVIVRALADEFGATFVPFQAVFNSALNEAPAEYWAPDGVHPSTAGHARMAQAWIRAVA